VKCEVLCLEENFQGTSFGHVFFKACQYAIDDEKVYRGLKYVSINSAQMNFQKCIAWPKKYGNTIHRGCCFNLASQISRKQRK
jgi:hypothetical protein